MTPKELADQAINKGTPIIELEPCTKCGNPDAVFYYQRKGRKHNGCLWCHFQDNNSLLTKANQEVLTSVKIVDDSGNPIYYGRACKECGEKVRIVGTAYGTKNKGACLNCAIHQQEERMHGKEIKRLNRAVTQKVHKFIVQSIERSGIVEVAPRSQQEFFEVRDLIYRCAAMNEQERALETGTRWEIGHRFPATCENELRGKATIDNLYLVQYEQNKKQSNQLPEEWTAKQVISIEGCREIQRSYEASKAWKEWKVWEKKLTPQERKERTLRELQENENHAARVRDICDDAISAMKFFADNPALLTLPSFKALLDKVHTQWDRVVIKMSRQIDAFKQRGDSLPYVEAREQRLTMEALCGANARLWLVVQTFQQIADAIEILKEQGMTRQQKDDVARLERYAVHWAIDIQDNPQVLVMGFTHPLLSVVGNPLIWGTTECNGKQWLCVWDNPQDIQAMLTPFDEQPDSEQINPVLIRNQEVPTSRHVVGLNGWNDTERDYIYERLNVKRAKAAKIERELQKAKDEATQKKEQKLIFDRELSRVKIMCMEGLDTLYWFSDGEWTGEHLKFAYRLIEEIFAEARQQKFELESVGNESELRVWQWKHSKRQSEMRNPDVVFSDLLQPF